MPEAGDQLDLRALGRRGLGAQGVFGEAGDGGAGAPGDLPGGRGTGQGCDVGERELRELRGTEPAQAADPRLAEPVDDPRLDLGCGVGVGHPGGLQQERADPGQPDQPARERGVQRREPPDQVLRLVDAPLRGAHRGPHRQREVVGDELPTGTAGEPTDPAGAGLPGGELPDQGQLPGAGLPDGPLGQRELGDQVVVTDPGQAVLPGREALHVIT